MLTVKPPISAPATVFEEVLVDASYSYTSIPFTLCNLVSEVNQG